MATRSGPSPSPGRLCPADLGGLHRFLSLTIRSTRTERQHRHAATPRCFTRSPNNTIDPSYYWHAGGCSGGIVSPTQVTTLGRDATLPARTVNLPSRLLLRSHQLPTLSQGRGYSPRTDHSLQTPLANPKNPHAPWGVVPSLRQQRLGMQGPCVTGRVRGW